MNVKELRKVLENFPRYEPEFYLNADGSESIGMEETEDGDYIEIKQLLSMLDSEVERGATPSKEE